MIVRPFKIVEDHKIINLIAGPSNDWPSYFFLMSIACLNSPAPGNLKREIIDKENISLTGIACYILSQLELLSMALELMLRLLILPTRFQIYFLLITFKYMLFSITKGFIENFYYI